MKGEVTLDWDSAVQALKARDTVLGRIIDQVGPCTPLLDPEAFRSLAESIIHQQLSMKVARTIVRRFNALFLDRPSLSPEAVLGTTDETLRETGLSWRKVLYLKDLAQKFLDNTITPSSFPGMTDQEIIEQLTKVKGVGRWTAEMFLIFSLGRPNVLPVGDLGFQRAVQQHYGPSALDGLLHELAERWEPYCTVATWYLWRSLELPAASPRPLVR